MPVISRPAQVLKLLLQNKGPRSGQEMGETLGCTRAAVGKAVTVLRSQGFVIKAKSNSGYSLVSEPDMLVPARVEARLSKNGLGLPFVHFETIDSTNLEARRRAETELPHGTCLATEFQSQGRGRLNRRWMAPKGSCVMFSLVLRPQLGLDMVFGLTSLTALAICRAIEDICQIKPMIKWPNDVFFDGVKLAGILTEFTSRAEQVEYVVVGAGLNANLTKKDLTKLDKPATSLLAATGKKWDRAEILAQILNEATKLYRIFCAHDHETLQREYAKRSWLLGKEVSVRDGQKIRTGIAKGMAKDGALLLQETSGQIITVRHGDVTVLFVG